MPLYKVVRIALHYPEPKDIDPHIA